MVLSLSVLISASCAEAAETIPMKEEQVEEVVEEAKEKTEKSAGTESLSTGNIVIDGIIGEDEYQYHIYNGSLEMDLYYFNDDLYLYVGIKSTVSGWIAIGFDPGSAMEGADIIFMTIDGDKVIMRDDFATGSYVHSSDEDLGGSFDLIEFAGTTTDKGKTFEFIKPLDSGDEFDKVLNTGNPCKIILAVNDKSSDFDRQHTQNSMSQMQLQ